MWHRIIIISFLFLTFMLNVICAKDDNLDIIGNFTLQGNNYCVFSGDYTPAPDDTTSVCLDWNHPALEVMRKRAEIIGNIKWTPLSEVPKRRGFFQSGVKVKGIPYSSVKELDKFVGQEVSFYTFLSAVNNPRSVLYTENVGQSPYHGKNCATYYGTVCSMTVNYALGLDRPYSTFMYGTLPFIKRVAQQDLEHVAPGDLIHFQYGHVILITDIEKNSDGSIKYLHYLESTGKTAFNRKYTKQQMQNRLDKHDHVIYRYMNLEKLATEPSPFPCIEAPLNQDMTYSAISLNRGDKVTYGENESCVIVNVLKEGYDKLEVYKSDNGADIRLKEISIAGLPDIELNDLDFGSYKVSLVRNDGTISETVCFEILQTDVRFSYLPNDFIDIRFSSMNAVPEYIVFCKENGGRRFIDDITEEERLSGHKLVKCEASLDKLFLKVFFRGEYGRTSNSMIPLG